VSSPSRAVLAAFALCCAGPAYGLPSFLPLGGGLPSRANGVSADGTWVVGTAGGKAFRWSAATGLQELGDGTANGVSDDGLVVVGASDFGSGREAYRWTAGGGMAPLGDLPGGGFSSEAFAVSGDGSIVVGDGDSGRSTTIDVPGEGPTTFTAHQEAFRWDATGGMQALGILGPGTAYGEYYSTGAAISADGSVIVGSTTITDNNTAYLWTEAGGMQGLPICGFCEQQGYGISPDGKKILSGIPHQSHGGTTVIWDRETGETTDFTFPDGTSFVAPALDASHDGSVLVGFLELEGEDEQHAWIWRAGEAQARLLVDVLAEAGLDLTGWHLEAATSISANGHTIAGYGINPDGVREAWVATIPEPATGVLVALGVAFLAAQRRRPGV
jgi:probable HAF family extracellular repeat protein